MSDGQAYRECSEDCRLWIRHEVHFKHELTIYKEGGEPRYSYPEFYYKLIYKIPLLLGKIIQGGVKAYLPRDVEKRDFYGRCGDNSYARLLLQV